MTETQITVVPNVDDPIPAFADVRTQVKALEDADAGVSFSEDEEKEARSYCMPLRKAAVVIDKDRKKLKAEAVAFGKRVDTVGKGLEGRVRKLIDKHMDPIEKRIAKAKEAAEKVEIQMASLKVLALLGDMTSDQGLLESHLTTIGDVKVTKAVFGERFNEAAQIQEDGAFRIGELLRQRKQYDVDQAELKELRAEKAKRAKQDVVVEPDHVQAMEDDGMGTGPHDREIKVIEPEAVTVIDAPAELSEVSIKVYNRKPLDDFIAQTAAPAIVVIYNLVIGELHDLRAAVPMPTVASPVAEFDPDSFAG